MEYRREIDGLRALAVIPVILFHAGFSAFSGGFVGVDVFFVISGYLITAIIWSELKQGTFSLRNFYERRARRILPPLFLMLFVCLPFAWLYLFPSDMNDFLRSLISVPLYISNIIFWRESNYFDTASELKPLLHTWSLAVEEQFYVFFPIFLITFWKFGKRRISYIVLLIAAISFGIAHWLSLNKPTTAFFLLPARGWELLVGSMLGIYLSEAKEIRSRYLNGNLLGWIGAALIFIAIFSYDKKTPFPGVYALLPTVGAALIILFATQETNIGRIVGNKCFVGIGIVSYSAYLWHQPLFAFARYNKIEQTSEMEFVFLSILSIVLAYFSWKYVETPFRNKRIVSRSFLFKFSVFLSIVFIAVGLLGLKFSDQITKYRFLEVSNFSRSNNLLETAKATSSVFIEGNRYDNSECHFSTSTLSGKTQSRIKECAKKYGPGIMIFGDSHAANLFNEIVENSLNKNYKFIVGITKNGCHLPTLRRECPYDEIIGFMSKNPGIFKHSIYEKAGYLLLDFPQPREHFRSANYGAAVTENQQVKEGVADYLTKVSKYSHVIWFGPRIEPMVTNREYLKYRCNHSFSMSPEQIKLFKNLDYNLKIFSNGRAWSYVSQIDIVQFEFPRDYGDCEKLLWIDMNHYSKSGEKIFGERIRISEILTY